MEYVYDEALRGTPGVRTVIVNYKESVTRESMNIAPIAGNHLVLNVNARLQAVVERELKNSVLRARSNGYRGDAGAAIVTDLEGRVLAMASYPDYDLNIWENGITVKQAKELYSDATGVPALSRAVQGVFAPASTFKVVSLSAAITADPVLRQLKLIAEPWDISRYSLGEFQYPWREVGRELHFFISSLVLSLLLWLEPKKKFNIVDTTVPMMKPRITSTNRTLFSGISTRVMIMM